MPVFSALARRLKRLATGDHGGAVFRNMLVLASGAGAARLITMIAVPVLARLYTPSDFGLLAVYTSLLTLMVPVSTLRYAMAIPLPKTDRAAVNLAALSLTILAAFGVLLTLVLWLVGGPLFRLLSAERLDSYWWLLVIGTLGASVYELLTLWSTRKKSFRALARSQVTQSLLGVSVKIALGFAGVKPMGLLLGQMFQQGGGVYLLARNMYHDTRGKLGGINLPTMKFLFLNYSDFPLLRLPSQILLTFSMQAPLLFFASNFGAVTAGQLSLALVAIGIPMQIFGGTIANAYYAEIAAIGRRDPEKIWAITIAVLKPLSMLSIGPSLVLFFFGPQIFSLFLGARWATAGSFASILSLSILAQFVTSPIVHALSVFGRQDLYLKLNVLRVTFVLLIFGSTSYFGWTAQISLAIYSVAISVHFLITSLHVLHVISRARAED